MMSGAFALGAAGAAAAARARGRTAQERVLRWSVRRVCRNCQVVGVVETALLGGRRGAGAAQRAAGRVIVAPSVASWNCGT